MINGKETISHCCIPNIRSNIDIEQSDKKMHPVEYDRMLQQKKNNVDMRRKQIMTEGK